MTQRLALYAITEFSNLEDVATGEVTVSMAGYQLAKLPLVFRILRVEKREVERSEVWGGGNVEVMFRRPTW